MAEYGCKIADSPREVLNALQAMRTHIAAGWTAFTLGRAAGLNFLPADTNMWKEVCAVGSAIKAGYLRYGMHDWWKEMPAANHAIFERLDGVIEPRLRPQMAAKLVELYGDEVIDRAKLIHYVTVYNDYFIANQQQALAWFDRAITRQQQVVDLMEQAAKSPIPFTAMHLMAVR